MAGKLNKPVKEFIVRLLACYETPSEVVKLVKEAFDGVSVARQSVEYYDPTKRASSNGKEMREDLRKLFWETRKAFNEDAARVGIGTLSYRLARLQRMADAAEARGNLPLAAQLYEQAAKDKGGFFTNKRKMEIKDKDPRRALAELLGIEPEALPKGKGEDDESVH